MNIYHMLRNDPESYFKDHSHIVPYRGDISVPNDPYFKLFLIFADHFNKFFTKRNGMRFNDFGLDRNREIVRDWDLIVSGLGCVAREKQSHRMQGHIGIFHPKRDHINGDMRSKFGDLIWIPYDLAVRILVLGSLP